MRIDVASACGRESNLVRAASPIVPQTCKNHTHLTCHTSIFFSINVSFSPTFKSCLQSHQNLAQFLIFQIPAESCTYSTGSSEFAPNKDKVFNAW